MTGTADVLAYIFTWLFVFAVPWQNMVILPGLGTISKVLGAGAIAGTLVHVVLSGKIRKPVAFHWVAIGYVCWVLLSVFWAVAVPDSYLEKVATYLQLLVMTWVIWEAAPTRARLTGLLQAYVLGAYVATGSTIYNYATGTTLAYERFSASGFDPNDLGMLLALALPMAWYITSTTSSAFLRWLNRAYFVAGTVAILLTSSRGALLAALAALSVIPWTLTRLRRGLRVATVVIMLGAGAAAVRFVPDFAFQRLSTTTSVLSGGTMSGRLGVWKQGLWTVPARPLQGYGPAGWWPTIGVKIGNRAPHSSWLAILVEEGIIGLVLYLALFMVVFTRLLVLPTFERRVSLTLLGTLVIAMTPLGWDADKAPWLVLALLTVWSEVLAPARPTTTPARRLPGAVRPPLRGAAPSTAR
jgi:O-antigen ligase